MPFALLCVLVAASIEGRVAQRPSQPSIRHVYDLGETVSRFRPAGDPAADPPDAAKGDDARAARRQREIVATSQLVEALKLWLADSKVVPPTAITVNGTTIVVEASRETHRALRDLLANLAQVPPVSCLVEIRLYRAEPDAWKKVVEPRLAAGRTIGQGEASGVVLDNQSASELLEALRSTAGIQVETAPRVHKRPLEPATIEVAEQVSYVERFEGRETPQGVILDPVIGIVKDGITVALGPTLARDSGVATTLATTLSHVARPIAEKKIKPEIAGREAQLTIQEPKVTEARGRVASVLPVQVPVFVVLPELAGRRPLVVVTLCKAGSL